MRVLITGTNGQVGRELLSLVPQGFDPVAMNRTALDITNFVHVQNVVAELKPDLIINAAAYTAVDKAEMEQAQAWAVNRDGAANLAIVAHNQGIPLLHISTDYVFAGDSDEPYTETGPTAPSGVYGESKRAGEEAVIDQCARHIILRTSWVFGVHGNNFVKTMVRLGQERDELGVVADQHGCPTSAASIARALWQLAAQYKAHGTLNWGIYHFCNAPASTWHQFAMAIFEQSANAGLLPHVPRVRPITTSDYPTPAKRPAWSVMDCTKIGTMGIAQDDWRVELRQVLETLNQRTAESTRAVLQHTVVADLERALTSGAQTTPSEQAKTR